jgi:hypothetical protein
MSKTLWIVRGTLLAAAITITATVGMVSAANATDGPDQTVYVTIEQVPTASESKFDVAFMAQINDSLDTRGFEFAYDFDGDGKADLVTEDALVKHTYEAEGTHRAVVRATDTYGNFDGGSTDVIIAPDAPMSSWSPIQLVLALVLILGLIGAVVALLLRRRTTIQAVVDDNGRPTAEPISSPYARRLPE